MNIALLTLLLGMLATGSQPPGAPAPPGDGVAQRVPKERFAELRFSNRSIVTFRAAIVPRDPSDRAESAERALSRLVDDGITGPVGTRPLLSALVVTVAGRDVFGLVPADLADEGEDLAAYAAQVTARLEVALAEAAEARAPVRLVRAAGLAVLATALLAAGILGLVRVRRAVSDRLVVATSSRLRSRAGFDLAFLRASRLIEVARGVVRLVALMAGGVFLYVWLSFVLQQFPMSRPWGEALGTFLTSTLARLALGAAAALPGLFTVALILLVARFVVRLSGLLFTAVEQGRIELLGLDAPKAAPTRRLIATLIWIFAVVVAYPYLPGSNTDAFKGVSVFVGLVVSLGSTGFVSHIMSGFLLTYSGALAAGDFVRIGDVEGIVTGVGVLSTKVRTRVNEEITIPNAVVVSGTTVNYSKYVRDGVYVTTAVTIGYDTPWRQVEAMLLAAAERTRGLRRDRRPSVLQTALSDFYVEYALLVCPEHPSQRVLVLAALHANIQDLFNEYGVQIMSPHYEADPPDAKVVPRAQWHATPAPAPDTEHDPTGGSRHIA